MRRYPFGTSVRMSTTFRNVDGDLFNPTTVNLLVVSSDGTETTYVYGTAAGLLRPSTGSYYMWLLPDALGIWRYGWQGVTTAATGTDDGLFDVERTVFYVDP